jgi:hypothetical protein
MHIQRRQFIIGGTAAGLLSTACWPAPAGAITPEAFGAKGDGRTNDTDAFAKMSAHVSKQGGGTVVLRPVTYIVGKHVPVSTVIKQPFAFAPATIMNFVGCSRQVTIEGNGATLRCEPGLRYGTFDPRTGRPTNNPMPNDKKEERASPYVAMIRAQNCRGGITISDIELDGNLQRLIIGGKFGNAGWQITGYGVQLIDNGPERLSRINSHHHAHDGIIIKGTPNRTASSVISDVTCDYNGRQGVSIIGGRNYAFERCRFRHTGKVVFKSAPGAGVDIEAEGGRTIRNISFTSCEFSDNAGPGLLAPVGDSEGVTFSGCTFVGTTSWAAWPKKPRYRFTNCTFVGAITNAYGDPDPNRAAQFHGCTFTDDPRISPTGQVFTGRGGRSPIAQLGKSQNVLFNRCRFALVGQAVLPLSNPSVRYVDCEMTQASPRRSRPRGTYLGTNRLSGNIDLGQSVISGTVILNGRTLPPGVVPGGPQ